MEDRWDPYPGRGKKKEESYSGRTNHPTQESSMMSPKTPINKGLMSRGTSIQDSTYPGGQKTFLGCFQRVRIEGRRGRGYWEWKAAEGRRMKSGHEGDDELTSIESDTMGRRSELTPPMTTFKPQTPTTSPKERINIVSPSGDPEECTEKDQLGHNVSSAIRVLPSYVPYERVPTSPLLQKPPLSLTSSRKPPLQPSRPSPPPPVLPPTLFERMRPSREPQSASPPESFDWQAHLTPTLARAHQVRSSPSPPPPPPLPPAAVRAGPVTPSTLPREGVYADAGSRGRCESVLPLEGHRRLDQSAALPAHSSPSSGSLPAKKESGTPKGILKRSEDLWRVQKLKPGPEYGFDRPPDNGKRLERESGSFTRPVAPYQCLTPFPGNHHTNHPLSPSTKFPSDLTLSASATLSNESELSSVTSYVLEETRPLLTGDSSTQEEDQPKERHPSTKETSHAAKSTHTHGDRPESGRSTSLVSLRSAPVHKEKKDSAERRSGALVWVSQPGGGAKLEWVPTPGLSTLRTASAIPARGRNSQVSSTRKGDRDPRGIVAGPNPGVDEGRGRAGTRDSSTSSSAPKGIIKRGDEGGGGRGGEARVGVGASEARAGASDAPRALAAGNTTQLPPVSALQYRADTAGTRGFPESPVGIFRRGHPQGQLQSHDQGKFSSFETGQSKNVLSSAPGVTRPGGRTKISATGEGISDHQNRRSLPQRPPSSSPDKEDKIVTVAGRGHGQTVRIRVRPEVHAYLSSLPVIRGGIGAPQSPSITARRDSIHSANSSSASGLTGGSGDGSVGYQEQDYEAVVDEYTLLKKAVDDHDPEALRLLTATEAALSGQSDN